MACKSITEPEIAAARRPHAQMMQSDETRDLETYFAINQKLHRAILLAAHNDTLTTSCQALSLRIQRARYLANMAEGRWYAAVKEHEYVLNIPGRQGRQ